jgi:hypothetical protein
VPAGGRSGRILGQGSAINGIEVVKGQLDQEGAAD